MNCPLPIEHILREAKLYRRYLETLEQEGNLREQTIKKTERFWNQIMMEFIHGLLDPCETELYCAPDGFAKEYGCLLKVSRNAHSRTMTETSLAQTLKFRDFKAAGVHSPACRPHAAGA